MVAERINLLNVEKQLTINARLVVLALYIAEARHKHIPVGSKPASNWLTASDKQSARIPEKPHLEFSRGGLFVRIG